MKLQLSIPIEWFSDAPPEVLVTTTDNRLRVSDDRNGSAGAGKGPYRVKHYIIAWDGPAPEGRFLENVAFMVSAKAHDPVKITVPIRGELINGAAAANSARVNAASR